MINKTVLVAGFNLTSDIRSAGMCSYTVAGETREVECGDSVLIPGDVPHSLTVLEEVKVIDVFSPEWEDFVG